MVYAIKHVAEILSRLSLEMILQSSFLVIKVVANIRILPAGESKRSLNLGE